LNCFLSFIVVVAQLIACDSSNFSKMIDERMRVNKGTNIVDPDLWCFDFQAHLTFFKCAVSFFFTNGFDSTSIEVLSFAIQL
jgi:hypothetical protein